jgi:hypothetical protein
VAEIRRHIGDGSLSRFVRESVTHRLQILKRELLVRKMAQGYGAEAEEPSLDPEWTDLEVEGL